MLAGEVKCPKCGVGFGDVSPDYDLGDYLELIFTDGTGRVVGHCRNNHRLQVQTYWPGMRPVHEVQVLE